jgi:hypothetical protein
MRCQRPLVIRFNEEEKGGYAASGFRPRDRFRCPSIHSVP